MNKAIRFLTVSAMAVLLGLASCKQMPSKQERRLATYPSGLKEAPKIRVLVLDKAEKATLGTSGAYRLEVLHLDGRKGGGGGTAPSSAQFAPTEKGLMIDGREVLEIAVIPVGDTRLSLGTGSKLKTFPGELVFSGVDVGGKGKKRLLRVICRLGLEEYLVGVIAGEMPAGWAPEALRAQAVASRSFALYRIKTREDKDFDVMKTVMSQVWRPMADPDPRILMAVNSTRGVVLTENWKLFPTYFHSECGGRTANARYVFLKEDFWPLSGVDCPYCSGKDAPKGWVRRIDRKTLSARLQARGLIQGMVKRVQPLDLDGTSLSTMQRVYSVRLFLDNGVEKVIPATELRYAIGTDRKDLPSTFFTVVHSTADIAFEGRGFGHGAGLCQHGSNYMAEKMGYLYEDILAHYYPGSKLVKLWKE